MAQKQYNNLCLHSSLKLGEILQLLVHFTSDKPLASESHYTLKADSRHLEIAGARLSDAALFTCIATNEAGTIEQSFDVEILGE